jgi:glycosyltransferase involved in cell wall biosynthesis
MSSSRPLLSVVVPTYNRPQHIADLLESVLAQSFDDWECVVAEDCSPAREQVKEIVAGFTERSGGRIRLHLNEVNYGYDRGVRTLIHLARGEYVFVMGDDDMIAPGALATVADAIRRYPNLGVIRGTIAFFHGSPDHVFQVSRYYPDEVRFPAGGQAIVAAYRRLVGMSGLVLHRDIAERYATDRWDGSLFYQHWVGANILVERDAVFLPPVLVYFRQGNAPIFGHAEAEKALYTPGVQPPDTDLKMIRYLLQIAKAVEEARGVPIYRAIHRDFGNYMYHTIKHQAHQPFPVFFRFYRDLAKMGFDRNPLFHAWFWSVALLGAKRVDAVAQWIRKKLGYTPNLTRFARA